MTLALASLAVGMLAQPATLIRKAPGSYVDGFWQDSSTETSIRAVVQAVSERDMRLLPEGERTEAYVTIWSTTELRVADEDNETTADVIRTETGDEYRVIRLANRIEGGFWRAIGRAVHDRGRSVSAAP